MLLDDGISFSVASQACISKAEINSYAKDEGSASAKAAQQHAQQDYCPECYKVKGTRCRHQSDKCWVLHPELGPPRPFHDNGGGNRGRGGGNGGRNGNHHRLQRGGRGDNNGKPNGGASSAQQHSGDA